MKKYLIVLVMFFCGVTLVSTCNAQTEAQTGAAMNHCVALLNGKQYPQAFACFNKLAKQGVSQAKFNMALMYDKGLGVKQNFKKSFKLYQEVARGTDQGSSFAQAKLGEIYLYGAGVKQDCKKAMYWLKKAAAKNNPWAIEDLERWKSVNYKCPPAMPAQN